MKSIDNRKYVIVGSYTVNFYYGLISKFQYSIYIPYLLVELIS